MIRQNVSSSNIRAIGYDAELQILEVEFHDGGIYQYSNVPEEIYEGFIAAPSHGSYLHQYIKDKYPYHKVN